MATPEVVKQILSVYMILSANSNCHSTVSTSDSLHPKLLNSTVIKSFPLLFSNYKDRHNVIFGIVAVSRNLSQTRLSFSLPPSQPLVVASSSRSTSSPSSSPCSRSTATT